MSKSLFIVILLIAFYASTAAYAQESKIQFFNSQADQFWHSNLDSAFYYTEEAYKLSFNSSNWQEISRAKANKGIAAYTKGNYLVANLFYDSAVLIASEHNLSSAKIVRLKAATLKKQSLYKEAIEFLQSELKETASTNPDYPLLQNAILALYIELGRIAEATDIIKEIDANSPTPEWSLQNGYLLLKIKYFNHISDFGKSDSIAKQLLIFYDSTDNLLDKSVVLLQLGENAMQVGKYDSSLFYLMKSAAIQSDINYDFGKAETNRLLGSLYSYLSKYDSATSYLFKALKTYDKNKTQNEAQKIYFELGWIYYSRGIYDKAATYLNQAIAIADEVGNMDYLGRSYNALGNVNYELKKYELSLKNYLKASKFRFNAKDRKGYAASQFNAAVVYDELGRKDKALAIYTEGYQIDRQYNDLLGMAIGEYTLAKFYLENGSTKKAKEYIALAINRLEKLKVRNELAVTYEIASQIYTATANYKVANKYLKAYQKIKDEIYLQEKNNEIDKLEARYRLQGFEQEIKLLNLEKKNTENELLIKDTTISNQKVIIYISAAGCVLLILLLYISYRFMAIRSKSNKELTQLNKQISDKQEEILTQAEELQEANKQIREMNADLEKRVSDRTTELIKAQTDLDLFFYKASHDFRGPLTTFMGLAEVAEISLKNPEALDLFRKVKTTAVKLDKMVSKLQLISLLNTKSLDTLDVNTIKINPLFDQLTTDFRELKDENAVKLIFETNTRELPFYDNYLKLILEVLIENGLTYKSNLQAFVKVIVAKNENKISIIVEDNGKGIPENKHEEVFNMFHRTSSLSTGNGLGLFLLKKIVTHLKGTISLSSKVNEGSQFTITFSTIDIAS